MRIGKSFFDLAAALFGALLLLVCPVHAQTISNTARADWNQGGAARSALSNTVDIAVQPPAIDLATYHPATGASGLSVRASLCGGAPLRLFPGSPSANVNVASTQTNHLRIGEILILRVAAPAANRNPSAIDQTTVTLAGAGGDVETLTMFETAPHTGIFTGAIRTYSVPPARVSGDCRLSVEANELITAMFGGGSGSPPLATISVGILADPYGIVFDSDDGTPVSGARVTLVDAASGAPATVFADDGLTGWPSSVITGEPIVDAAGVSHPMGPGEYRFPMAALGSYRVKVEPPSPYAAPSKVPAASFAGLVHADGTRLEVSDASYGASFVLASIEPVRVDVPIDRPSATVTIQKSASRTRAQPGDAVFYTLTITNPDATRVKRNVTVIDNPSEWLRLRPDSVRVDGAPAGDLVTIARDGRRLAFAFDTVAAGSSVVVTYAMTVRADAPAGQAINRAVASDPRGGDAVAEAAVKIERDTLTSRMTIVGRVSLGSCSRTEGRPGIPGVRVMLEDGSFAITDRDGRYHFEGVVPGTHVVQVQRQTLPAAGEFVDCERSTRSAGSAISRFVIGQGGSLAVADFHADVPGWEPPATVDDAVVLAEDAAAAMPTARGEDTATASDREASGAETDWLALGDGPTEFLFPQPDHNPRVPAVRVVIRHEAGQTVELSANGKPVDPLALDGTSVAGDRNFAVSVWRGIPLTTETTRLVARVRNADGSIATELSRDVVFVSAPWKAEIVTERSHLVADGATRPVVAIRFTDRKGRPVRAGVTGSFALGEPYESAAMLEQLQLGQLIGRGSASANWIIEGDDGIALIELAPTMVSGPLHLEFNFTDGDVARQQQLDTWVVPGDLEWTIVGLAEGTVGAKSVADNMGRTGRFDSDLGDDARVALYAKGRVLGRFLMTLAYDSAKQKDDQRLLGTLDPDAYYTVFADGSARRFDAASREKLYVRIETATFYALYGDFVTGFEQTVLARYQRTATGVKAEGLVGGFHAQGFAAKIASRYRHDEIQGNGLTGPYRLRDRDIVANSETVAIEVRDRFRSEIVIGRRELVRFLDYDIDLLSGTITFKEPVLSRDFDLNPQFIVIDYEVDDGIGASAWNAGVRTDFTAYDGALRIGATAITDKGDSARTDLGALDLRARIGDRTEIRAELGMSRSAGETAEAWLVEAEHRTGSLDVLAYARSLDQDYGTGQQTGAELGRRKIGVDARYELDQRFAVVASAWYDDSLVDDSSRRALQATATYRTGATEARLGIAHFSDRLADGDRADSTVLEGGVSQRLFDNKLELSATTSIALDKAQSIDLPARHRLRASYAVTDWLRAIGTYEIADGETIEARTFNAGFELSPWRGSRVVTSLGRQDIGELGKRTFAAFGLSQSVPVSPTLTIGATLDGNRKLGGADISDVVNPEHPVASGGHLSQDGALFEDFTAITLGGAWRKDAWAATMRGEYRDGEFADRKGVTGGVIRQLADGVVVGGGGAWTRATGENLAASEILDGSLAVAFRPAESALAFLGKIEFRSDRVEGAIAGETGPAGRTALIVNGDAKSQRVIASLSTNWSPRGADGDGLMHRTEIGVFVGGRYNFDRLEDFDLSGTTLLGGLDARIGIGERFEIGGVATVRANVSDGTTSFAIGPQIGFSPAQNAVLTVGYNLSGFRDEDFSAARSTERGLFASVRLKFDADSFAFLGLGRR